MKKLFLLSAVLLLSACGTELDGTYTDNMGTSYTFESNGKMTQSVMGMAIEMNYEVDGNKVKLIAPQGTFVLALLEDGSIQGSMGPNSQSRKSDQRGKVQFGRNTLPLLRRIMKNSVDI